VRVCGIHPLVKDADPIGALVVFDDEDQRHRIVPTRQASSHSALMGTARFFAPNARVSAPA